MRELDKDEVVTASDLFVDLVGNRTPAPQVSAVGKTVKALMEKWKMPGRWVRLEGDGKEEAS